MGRERTEAEIAAWKAGDAERNERARRERLRRDGARGLSENLAEGVGLTRFAHRFAGAAGGPTSDPPLDPDGLMRCFARGRLRYVLVDGLAVNAYGVIRATKQVGICADPEHTNLARLAAMLHDLDAVLVGDNEFETRLGNLDIVRLASGVHGDLAYPTLARDAMSVELAGVLVPVCSLAHLREMKRAAGRPQDLQDLADLAIAQPEPPG